MSSVELAETMPEAEEEQNAANADPQQILVEEDSFGSNVLEAEPEPAEGAGAAEQHLGFFRGLAKFSWQFFWTGLQASWWLIYSTARYLRYHPLHALSSAILVAVVMLLLITGSKIHEQTILNQISDETVDRVIAASRFTRSYQRGEAGQTGVHEFLRVGGPEWAQREGIRAILFHARRSNLSLVDQAILLATAEIESGFNPMAKAPTTTACGLFQFVRQTGVNFGLDPKKCMDPWLNAKAGVQHYLFNYEHAVEQQVKELSGAERVFKQFEHSYYLHHDGPNSSRPSAEVKATVLSGVQFLFRVYGELQEEAQSKQQAPTFAHTFAEDVWQVLSPIISGLSLTSEKTAISLGKLGSLVSSFLVEPN